jgi:hypothetical protein
MAWKEVRKELRSVFLISVGLRTLQRRDGVTPISRWLVLQRHLKTVADLVSDTENAELPQDHDEAPLELEDLISTEAASMLGLTERQMRNLASQLGGRRAGRAWVSTGHWWSWRLVVGGGLTMPDDNRDWKPLRCGGCVSVWPIS